MPRPGKSKHPPVSWSELPHKSQLILLTMARLSEPLTMSSLRSYMFYQLKSFDPSLPDSTISYQAGLLAAGFTFAQMISAVPWGKAADSEYVGRKKVLLVGLLGTGISVLGFGFSRSFWVAMLFRMVGGILNGNVGVMRTMVSELIRDKKYQSRAFMIMPMTGNVGQIIGPMIGGLLADPAGSYPGIFGPGSLIGGKDGVQWMIKYPYALPNLISALFLIGSALIIILGLEETHYLLRDRPDWGLEFGRWLKRTVFPSSMEQKYSRLPNDDSPYNPFSPDPDVELQEAPSPTRVAPKPPAKKSPIKRRQTLPFRRIFTRNVLITLFSRGLLAMHIGTFQNIWYIFLSTPRAKDNNILKNGLFHFTGGMGLPPSRIGLVLSIIGCIGIFFQIMLYPPISARFGTVRCYRVSLLLFPPALFLVPFLAVLPSSSKPPLPAAGIVVWTGLLAVLFIHVLGRTFAIPSATILVNNCCPHPSVLSTVHGVAQSVSSGMRMLGPLIGGGAFGLGLQIGLVGLPFWIMAVISMAGAVLSLAVYEGDGHEIKLEGEEEEPEEKPLVERTDVETIEGALDRRGDTSRNVHTP